MRDIRFRAWDKEKNKMMVGLDFQCFSWDYGAIDVTFNDGSFVDASRLENCILMQYTGLKDKNGVEIYEGDIVKDKWGVGEVVWLDSRGGWAITTEDDYFYPHAHGKYKLTETEVIGNRYQNPELLKEKQMKKPRLRKMKRTASNLDTFIRLTIVGLKANPNYPGLGNELWQMYEEAFGKDELTKEQEE